MKLKPSAGSASKKPQSRKSSGKSTGKFCNGFSNLTRLYRRITSTDSLYELSIRQLDPSVVAIAWESSQHFATPPLVLPRQEQISHATRPIKGITQIWVVTRHQYGISALVYQKSFRVETSGGVAKSRPFSQASFEYHFHDLSKGWVSHMDGSLSRFPASRGLSRKEKKEMR